MTDFALPLSNPFADAPLPRADEPNEAVPIGNPEEAPVGIYLSHEVARFIDTYTAVDPERSLSGLLLGHVGQSNQRPFVLITGVIENAGSLGDPKGPITFTPQTWRYAAEIWNREYPHTLVVGTFFSNPGMDARLTAYHRFTQYRLFPHPWQIAFVVDPRQPESCFYRWRGDSLVPVCSFYLWEPTGDEALIALLAKKTPLISASASTAASAAHHGRRAAPRIGASFGLMLLLLVIGILFLPSVSRYLPGIGRSLQSTEQELQNVIGEIQQLQAAQAQLLLTAPQEPPALPVSDSTEEPQAAQADAIQEPNDLFRRTASHAVTQSGAMQSLPDYTVQPGDTLWTISERLLGNPQAYRDIAAANSIANPDLIFPGTPLYLRLNGSDPEITGTDE